MQIPDLSDIPELKPVEPGEYDLTVIKATDIDKNGRKGVLLIINIDDNPEADTIFHNLILPGTMDDEIKSSMMNRMVKEFIVALGLDPAATETEHFNGIQFSALLKLDDYQGRISNKIVRIT